MIEPKEDRYSYSKITKGEAMLDKNLIDQTERSDLRSGSRQDDRSLKNFNNTITGSEMSLNTVQQQEENEK
jgi:hypothetical protein